METVRRDVVHWVAEWGVSLAVDCSTRQLSFPVSILSSFLVTPNTLTRPRSKNKDKGVKRKTHHLLIAWLLEHRLSQLSDAPTHDVLKE